MGWLKGFIIALAVALASPAAAQAPPQPIVCPDPLKPMLRAELFFGRNIAGKPGVSERAWAQFLTRELTPLFADGLTVIDGKGQWRDGGAIVREKSKIVIVVMADDAAAREHIAAAAAAYIKRFNQRSIGIVTQPVCTAF